MFLNNTTKREIKVKMERVNYT